MNSAHIVVIEARNVPDLADKLYTNTVRTLDARKVGHSRITVPHVLNLPVALRTVIEATRGGGGVSGTEWRRPDGYIILGSFIESQQNYTETIFREILRNIQDIACYYTLPVSYGFIANAKAPVSEAQITQAVENATACIHLIDLKKQLGLTPGAILAP
jgi:6,7-dimethyl-8-ribityllumazine synthase